MKQRRSLIGWLSAVSLVPLLAVGLATLPGTTIQAATDYSVTSTVTSAGTSIIDVTPDDKFAVYVGKDDNMSYRVRSLNLATTPPTVVGSANLSALLPPATLGLTSPRASSVAVSPSSGGSYYALVTLREGDNTLNTAGKVAVIDINSTTGALSLRAGVAPITVGVNPESIDIAPNGEYAIVANEGNPLTNASNVVVGATNGSISVIDLRAGRNYAVQTYTPEAANPQPETVAVAPNSGRAFVTLQANNAVEIINMGVDGTSGDLTVNGTSITLPETLKPDGIAVTADSGYIVTANELALQKSVSLFQVTEPTPGSPTLTAVGAKVVTTGFTPKMVTIGSVPGTAGQQAFVSLRDPNASNDQLGVFNIAPSGLTLTTGVVLNAAQLDNTDDPEGVAVAPSRGLILTANAPDRTISVIRASDPSLVTPTATTTTTTTPTEVPTVTPTTTTTPTVTPSGWLPLILK